MDDLTPEQVKRIIAKSYRILEEISEDIKRDYEKLKEDYPSEETLKERLQIFNSLEKSLSSFVKNIPPALFEERMTLRDAILQAHKLVEKVKQGSRCESCPYKLLADPWGEILSDT